MEAYILIPLNKLSNGHTEISVENVNLLKDILVASLETDKEREKVNKRI